MVTYLPIPSPFVRLAGFWVDDALSFAMGWNYFFLMGSLSYLAFGCFDLTNRHSFQHPVRNHRNPRVTHLLDRQSLCSRCDGDLHCPLQVRPANRVLDATNDTSVLNGLTVRYFGVSEFYMSIFKIFLMVMLMMYTFVTMVGGNPREDAYGFRYWEDPVCLFPQFLSLLPLTAC